MAKLNFQNLPRTIWLEQDKSDGIWGLYLIDQTRLPLQGDILCCRTLEGVRTCVQSLAVRGAPALGVTAAMALAIWAVNEFDDSYVANDTAALDAAPENEFLAKLQAAVAEVSSWRPTAVNLAWGAQSMLEHVQQELNKIVAQQSIDNASKLAKIKDSMLVYAQQMAKDDEAANRAMGSLGATELKLGASPLTICNAGSLATAFYGTALGVIYSAYERDIIQHLWVTETRPVNQGARLTMWELTCVGVPATLITDSMAATVMSNGLATSIIVGADRICANGDTVNKIGTLSLAVLANHYGLPFYVVAPRSTIDAQSPNGAAVTIEQRDGREIAGVAASGVILPQDKNQFKALDLLTCNGASELVIKNGHQLDIARKGGGYAFDAWLAGTVSGAAVFNPAFDVTPAGLISAIVTQNAIFRPPFAF
ncbi:MAG: S-methyl-5-thioribose-1-phosphate isomerase [Coriobacteriales bacterium]|nr:S-methyl-5-thioribose-1-phosphate isomerase [Coriobacteriales bacterium]